MDRKNHYTNIFAWAGLVLMLQTCSKEEFTMDMDAMQEMLLAIMISAKSYNGDNPQIRAGYIEVLDSLPMLRSFYPELESKLAMEFIQTH